MQGRIISEFTKLVNNKDAIIASQVYLELCEVKRYYDISYYFNSALNKICINAKKTKTGPECIFLPIAVYEDLNFLKIQNILHSVPSDKLLYLVIVQSDSTCVYYQLAENLLEPTDTTAKHLKENKQEKLDNDLRKNREILENGALLGLKVTIK